MQKVRLLVHTSVASDVIDYVQKAAFLELREINSSKLDKQEKTVFEFNYVNSRLEFAVNFLLQYGERKGKLDTLINGSAIPVKEEYFDELLHSFAFNEAVDEAASMQEDINTAANRVAILKDEYELLKKWREFPAPLGSFDTEYTQTLFLEQSDNTSDNTAEESFIKALEDLNIEYHKIHISRNRFVLVILKQDLHSVRQTAKSYEAALVSLPQRRGTPEEELIRIKRAIVKAENKKSVIEQKVRVFAKENLEKLQIISDYISWKKEKHDVVSSAYSLNDVLVFEGWCPKQKLKDLKDCIKTQTSLADIAEISADKGEDPPVEIRNNKIIAPFESVTRLYGLPGYRDLDPTVFLAGFFFIFFGLSLTDVGYGLFLFFATMFALLFFKIPKDAKPLVSLLMFGGISSIAIGLLFGGYFGIDMKYLPHWAQSMQKFDPIANPLPVFYMALGFGVLQIIFGLILKIIRDAKNGELISGILDQGPWIALFLSLMLWGADKAGLVFTGGGTSAVIIYASLASLVLTQGRKEKGIIKKIFKGIFSIYDSISYFSDILSYSRLLALGLATSALAFAVNLIAKMVGDMVPYVGPILMVLILIVGHLFNMAVNVLGAFIHSARLQFVEFFGKFIVDNGKVFTPLKRKERYVVIK